LNALIDKMRGELNSGRPSFARGKVVFDNQCAKCHKFDGRGHQVGPDIEGAGRDVEYLLTNVLDPNRVIGAPYFMRTLNLADGSVVTGVLAAEDDQTVTIKTENAVMRVIPKKDIEEHRTQEKSLMPEGLANNMSVQDFRDLVRYVMANPFITDVRLNVGGKTSSPVVPPSGRIGLPNADAKAQPEIVAEVTAPEAMDARLMLGFDGTATVLVNDSPADNSELRGAKSAPDQVSVSVKLKKGVNRITIRLGYSGKDQALFARFVDPDRKLFYHDWLPEPK
jgi:putative heme-binding domain-containing protein